MTDAPKDLPDIFAETVDGVPVQLVRPGDSSDPVWVVYTAAIPLGTVSWIQHDEVPAWAIQTRPGRHASLSDALRTLIRPRSARDEEM
ncbi:hypothetical protein ABTY59_33585 [Streptomyces sp. NPDC096079]|uniref:hypothetical protein n=1 Tax=Streptomyces sp. NPDC096079 TaxID=3155820 RepID=UPI00333119AF